MSKQTKHRYLNSFFITTILYLVASFFLFYVFADTLVVQEKKQEELKISLNSMMVSQEPTPTTQPTPSEPIIEKKMDKPKKEKRHEEKKHDHKKTEHKKHIKEPIVENNTEIIETANINSEIVQNTKPIAPPTNQINTAQVENIEAAYLSQIRASIEKNKTYPKVAKRLNQTGKVYVTFLVTKDGAIKNCRINKSSNFESLDEASLEALIKIVSFEAIPKELNKDSWEITVPIVYQIS